MRFSFLAVLLCTLSAGMRAEMRQEYIDRRNELRIGWGDQLFESLVWHNPTGYVTQMPASYTRLYHENYHHDQHLWLEYQWRHLGWFSCGGMVDMSDVRWDDVTRNGQGEIKDISKGHYFYNLVVMPTMRFTYFFHPNFNLYSALGGGICINGGTEPNRYNQRTGMGAAANITLLGMSANYNRWFFSFDIGSMFALRDMQTVYLLSSRMMTAAIGVRF